MFEHEKAVIHQLSEILAGRAPIAHGERIIAEDVVCHLDGLTFRGRGAWRNWIAYIRSRPHIARMDALVDGIEADAEGFVTLVGRWRGEVRGVPTVSDRASARYRVEGGQVREIWTTRGNYVFMFGGRMRRWPGCLAVLAEMAVRQRLGGSRRPLAVGGGSPGR